MMKRTDVLRQMIYNAPYEICIERAKYWTESYKETEEQPPAIRAAKALERTLEKMSIYILDQEQIVGNRTSKLVAISIPVERGDITQICELELRFIKKREVKPFQISSEDERQLKEEIFPYWKGQTVVDLKRARWKQRNLYIEPNFGIASWIRRLRQFGLPWCKTFFNLLVKGRLRQLKPAKKGLCTNNPNLINNIFDVQGHLVMGHKNIVREGYGSLKTKIQDQLSKVTGEKKTFLESALICANAASNFILRFAKLAETQATGSPDAARKKELEDIAATCRQVAEGRPRTFREALQLVWFNQVIGIISSGMPVMLALGRVDQYLYPFYQADVKQGLITDAEVRELFEELLIKTSYNMLMLPSYGKLSGSELGADNQAITVGGLTPAGNDGTNELSYLFLDAIENVRSMVNSFSMRVSPTKSPRRWVERVIEVFYKTRGGPAVFNDDALIPSLQKTGASVEDARDYGIIGCVEPMSQGATFGPTAGNDMSLVGPLEMVLTNGMIRNVGKKTGPQTGNPRQFQSYDEVWQAYLKQLKHTIDLVTRCVIAKDEVYAERYPAPFISLTLDECLENATDVTRGGTKYNYGSITGRGFATVVNSLAAIKKLVFDEKQVSMAELLQALDSNFKGAEKLQTLLKNKAPKYGNDDDYVDTIAHDVARAFCDEVMSHKCALDGRGGIFRPGFFSYGIYIIDGFFLGATPDGRNAGSPVSNSLSPANCTEKRGPTAVFKSVAKVDHSKIPNGMSLNMRLLPALLETPEKRSKFADLLLAYFELGAQHVQFNVVNQEDLIDAQAHPEKHQDLVVRVSGYSAYFIDLGKPVQDDIIERYQFSSI